MGGKIHCPSHDTNGDGYCTDCKNTGYVTCHDCYGNQACPTCHGSGN
jgi:hypothetical protein